MRSLYLSLSMRVCIFTTGIWAAAAAAIRARACGGSAGYEQLHHTMLWLWCLQRGDGGECYVGDGGTGDTILWAGE